MVLPGNHLRYKNCFINPKPGINLLLFITSLYLPCSSCKDCATFLPVKGCVVWRQSAKPFCWWHHGIQYWLWSKKFALDFDFKNLVESEWHSGVGGNKGETQSLYRILFSLWFLLLIKGRGQLRVCGGEDFVYRCQNQCWNSGVYVWWNSGCLMCVESIPSLGEAELQVPIALKGRWVPCPQPGNCGSSP